MPRLQLVPRSHTLLQAGQRSTISFHFTRLIRLLLLAIIFVIPAAPAHAAPQLWLPIPSGETWKIIQGYGCGSHNSWDRYSLDLVNTDGRTRGAPVRAAADGQIWSWTAKSGTLILSHGGGFYTMYTHMDSAVTTRLNTNVARGDVIGRAGARAANGTPHLHFTAFTGSGIAASNRRSVPLAFAEGFDLPDTGGCNQHGGEKLTAGGPAAPASTTVSFNSDAQPERWYNADKRIEFNLPSGASGFSQSWDHAPNGDAPQFSDTGAGFMELSTVGEGLHTLQLRYWDAAGQSATASYGPVGYDVTPPQSGAPSEPVTFAAGTVARLSWNPATDNAAGVSGYRVYIGSDPNGTADWFSAAPQVDAPALAAGTYVLRVQPIDYADNAGAWITVEQITITE